MTIDIHEKIGKLPIIPKKGFVLPNMRFCGPFNPLEKQLIHDEKGNILKYIQPPTGKTDEICSVHDVKYSLAKNLKDKHIADQEMINSINKLPYKDRQWGTFLAKNIISSKKKLGLGNYFTMEDLSEELNRPVINKFPIKKIIVNYIDEIHSCDLVDMVKYSRMNKGYKQIFTNIDVSSKYAWNFPIKSKKISDIKPCFQKIFKERKPKFIWSDKESSFFSNEMLKFFEDHNIKIYYTNSNLKAVVIERFNRSLRELMMKEFAKTNNTIWYNILPKLIKFYNNRFHNTIKDKPININKSNEKYIKNTIYKCNITNKIPNFKINDIVRISLKRRELLDKPSSNIEWSEELLKIHSINKSNVITYEITDMNNEIIQGIFYEKELQKSKMKEDGLYIIEKIIKKVGNKYLVKWKGYDNTFNSYVNENDIVNMIS